MGDMLSFRVGDGLLEDVGEVCRRLGVSRSLWLRSVVEGAVSEVLGGCVHRFVGGGCVECGFVEGGL